MEESIIRAVLGSVDQLQVSIPVPIIPLIFIPIPIRLLSRLGLRCHYLLVIHTLITELQPAISTLLDIASLIIVIIMVQGRPLPPQPILPHPLVPLSVPVTCMTIAIIMPIIQHQLRAIIPIITNITIVTLASLLRLLQP